MDRRTWMDATGRTGGRQARTTRCQFDEDCPEGTVCLCPYARDDIPGQFCAAATDRETAEGRSAGLVCP